MKAKSCLMIPKFTSLSIWFIFFINIFFYTVSFGAPVSESDCRDGHKRSLNCGCLEVGWPQTGGSISLTIGEECIMGASYHHQETIKGEQYGSKQGDKVSEYPHGAHKFFIVKYGSKLRIGSPDGGSPLLDKSMPKFQPYVGIACGSEKGGFIRYCRICPSGKGAHC